MTNKITPNLAANGEFLPADYEIPSRGNNYMKLQDGKNKIRILSKPVIGWLDWKDKKPLRFRMNDKPKPVDPAKPVKHFWAFVVYNYQEHCIQVLEITQATIQQPIQTLYKDADWGSPFDYDITINKSGVDLATKYNVTPVGKTEIHEKIREALIEKGRVNMDALYDGEDPFSEVAEKEVVKDDLPF